MSYDNEYVSHTSDPGDGAVDVTCGTLIGQTQSPSVGKLMEAMAKAQANVVVPKFNRVGQARGGRYKYADLGAILQAAYATYSPHGVAVICQLNACGDGSHIFICRLHFGEEFIASTIHVPKTNEDQQMGARLTYRRRYNLALLCGLFAEEDGDEGAIDEAPRQARPSPARSEPAPARDEPKPEPVKPEPVKPKPATGTRKPFPQEQAEALANLAEDKLEAGKAPTEDECRAMFQHYRSRLYAFDTVEALEDWWGLHKGWVGQMAKINRTAGELMTEQYANAKRELMKEDANA